jgi:hypothetical protein
MGINNPTINTQAFQNLKEPAGAKSNKPMNNNAKIYLVIA